MNPDLNVHDVTVYVGDCLDILPTLPADSVDAIVTDPPYGLGFMGKAWDTLPPGREWAEQCLRVLKPGGHLLAFGGTRTWHRLAVAVEDAGFEIRDSIAWLYGSGFPKSLDVGKAIDKAAVAERELTGDRGNTQCAYMDRGEVCPGHADAGRSMSGATVHRLPTAPATDAARQWDGWGTALKPAFEPIIVARKPLTGTVAGNVLTHGTGALNIDDCRIGTDGGTQGAGVGPRGDVYGDGLNGTFGQPVPGLGRWPANVILDESQAAALDQQSGDRPGFSSGARSGRGFRTEYVGGEDKGWASDPTYYGDTGGASRFYFVAKAPQTERPNVDGTAHPTVKPLELMRWLVRLVTPRGGVVLDMFAGTGTTGEACALEEFRCILMEREPDYLPLIEKRLHKPVQTGFDFGEPA
jgi:hypothetical protein